MEKLLSKWSTGILSVIVPVIIASYFIRYHELDTYYATALCLVPSLVIWFFSEYVLTERLAVSEPTGLHRLYCGVFHFIACTFFVIYFIYLLWGDVAAIPLYFQAFTLSAFSSSAMNAIVWLILDRRERDSYAHLERY